jgi:hypothetical protein
MGSSSENVQSCKDETQMAANRVAWSRCAMMPWSVVTILNNFSTEA